MSWKILVAEYLRKQGLHAFWLLPRYGWLHDRGWFRSYKEGRPVDANGKAVPWLSYSFVQFLEPLLRTDVSIFEYGCGSSTLWFASRVASVFGVEHDAVWYNEIKGKLPASASIVLQPDAGQYPQALATANTTNGPFDLILIDGIARETCLALAPAYLSARGVLVLDNAERPAYRPSVERLRASGFREVPFIGLSPASVIETTTSVLYRDGNWLGL